MPRKSFDFTGKSRGDLLEEFVSLLRNLGSQRDNLLGQLITEERLYGIDKFLAPMAEVLEEARFKAAEMDRLEGGRQARLLSQKAAREAQRKARDQGHMKNIESLGSHPLPAPKTPKPKSSADELAETIEDIAWRQASTITPDMQEQRKLASEFILEMANSAPRKPVAPTTTQGMAHRTPEEPQREGRPSWLEEPTGEEQAFQDRPTSMAGPNQASQNRSSSLAGSALASTSEKTINYPELPATTSNVAAATTEATKWHKSDYGRYNLGQQGELFQASSHTSLSSAYDSGSRFIEDDEGRYW
ncbi:MAG: hypothetical protein M1816_004902 [Peltula sp. TS41687]|nr:MAG: hypothetical protein M1816_004902 [Peltula sp. TS41687]